MSEISLSLKGNTLSSPYWLSIDQRCKETSTCLPLKFERTVPKYITNYVIDKFKLLTLESL